MNRLDRISAEDFIVKISKINEVFLEIDNSSLD